MATVSMTKDFLIHDQKAFERFQKDIEQAAKKRPTTPLKSSSLEYGGEKLKQFSFR